MIFFSKTYSCIKNSTKNCQYITFFSNSHFAASIGFLMGIDFSLEMDAVNKVFHAEDATNHMN